MVPTGDDVNVEALEGPAAVKRVGQYTTNRTSHGGESGGQYPSSIEHHNTREIHKRSVLAPCHRPLFPDLLT
jgi:hypothetical protein